MMSTDYISQEECSATYAITRACAEATDRRLDGEPDALPVVVVKFNPDGPYHILQIAHEDWPKRCFCGRGSESFWTYGGFGLTIGEVYQQDDLCSNCKSAFRAKAGTKTRMTDTE